MTEVPNIILNAFASPSFLKPGIKNIKIHTAIKIISSLERINNPRMIPKKKPLPFSSLKISEFTADLNSNDVSKIISEDSIPFNALKYTNTAKHILNARMNLPE